MLLFTLTLVRTSLIDSWKNSVRDDAPNHFVYNIYADDKPSLIQFFEGNSVETSLFFPITFGRVIGVNDKTIKELIQNEEEHIREQGYQLLESYYMD